MKQSIKNELLAGVITDLVKLTVFRVCAFALIVLILFSCF